jgi:hypothetical protein
VHDRPRTYRRELPQPDERGRMRPVVGRTLEGVPARFTVGTHATTSPADALKRLNAIRDLYARQCAELGIDYWAGWVHSWAVRLAQGVPIVVYASGAAQSNEGQAAEELAIVQQLQSWGVPITIADPRLQTLGYGFLRKRIDEEVSRAVNDALGGLRRAWGDDAIDGAGTPPATSAASGTLHRAIVDCITYTEEHGKKDAQGGLAQSPRKYMERLEALREHYADCPLWRLDVGGINRLAGYWRQRPTTKRGGRCSARYAKMMMQELWRLLNWIDKRPRYNWTKPRGVDEISRDPVPLPEDDGQHETAFRSAVKLTYTPEQLAVIVQYADGFEKALIGVCVNCAFGASEVGQWHTRDYRLFTKHPHADKLGITSTDADSWIVGKRPKTGIYGEHLLWDEVARAVKPFLDGRAVLPITNMPKGKPWYRTYSKNAQSQFGNWWAALLERVREHHSDFPRLAFGTLRDLLPNILRREYSDEVASIALQHGKLSGDDLLRCYANLPYRKLFDATRQLRTMFEPFLVALRRRKSWGTPISIRPPDTRSEQKGSWQRQARGWCTEG